MALARLSRLPLNAIKMPILHDRKCLNVIFNQSRSAVFSETGAILPKPDRVPWGMAKVSVVVFLSVYIGGTISKNGAAFLEEHDIFVPDEDDD